MSTKTQKKPYGRNLQPFNTPRVFHFHIQKFLKKRKHALEIPSICFKFRVCAPSRKWMFTSAADDIPHRRTFLTDNTTKESLILYEITPHHPPLQAFNCYILSCRAFDQAVSLPHPQG